MRERERETKLLVCATALCRIDENKSRHIVLLIVCLTLRYIHCVLHTPCSTQTKNGMAAFEKEAPLFPSASSLNGTRITASSESSTLSVTACITVCITQKKR